MYLFTVCIHTACNGMHVKACVLRSEDNFSSCFFLFFFHLVLKQVLLLFLRLGYTQDLLADSAVSASHVTVGVLG